jgi:hypothetical protein
MVLAHILIVKYLIINPKALRIVYKLKPLTIRIVTDILCVAWLD